jgi:hypothetical protein
VNLVFTTRFSGGTGVFAGASGSTEDSVEQIFIEERGPEGCTGDNIFSLVIVRGVGTIGLPDG